MHSFLLVEFIVKLYLKEVGELMEMEFEFEHVTDMEGFKIFRKRKQYRL